MHPEHPDPEAEILWMRMRQPGIKGIKLHGQMAQLKLRGIRAHFGLLAINQVYL